MTDCNRCAGLITMDEYIVVRHVDQINDYVWHYCSAKCMIEDHSENKEPIER